MPGTLEPRDPRSTAIVPRTISHRTSRALSAVEHQTLVRTANVQGEGLVQTEKLHEIDSLTREALTGQALLAKWRDTLAAGDVFLADELKFFTDIARLGKGEIIADTIQTFCRESRS